MSDPPCCRCVLDDPSLSSPSATRSSASWLPRYIHPSAPISLPPPPPPTTEEKLARRFVASSSDDAKTFGRMVVLPPDPDVRNGGRTPPAIARRMDPKSAACPACSRLRRLALALRRSGMPHSTLPMPPSLSRRHAYGPSSRELPSAESETLMTSAMFSRPCPLVYSLTHPRSVR